MKKFPVFVFPVSLEIHLGARHTFKQLLTLYNPYYFAVSFDVTCTAPDKFLVIDPHGVIAPMSCIDIVVRYTQTSVSHSHATEKFRINMYDRDTQEHLGKTDIVTKLVDSEPDDTYKENTHDTFHSLEVKATMSKQLKSNPSQIPKSHYSPYYRESQPINILSIVIGIVCIVALLLPTQQEAIQSTQMPDWLHITLNVKLIFAFVLGLVSSMVIRS